MPMPTASPVSEELAELAHRVADNSDFAALVAELRNGHSGTIDGAWGSSASLAVGALAREAPSTILVVLAHPGDLDAWSEELQCLCPKAHPLKFPIADEPSQRHGRIDESQSRRLRILQTLRSEPPRLLLASVGALIQPVPERQTLERDSRRFRVGDPLDIDEFSAWLVEHGYKRVDAVEYPGDFSRRGGIFDLFPPDADCPIRLEMFGDEIESIRRFATDTQRSLGDVEMIMVLGIGGPPPEPGAGTIPAIPRGHLADYLPPNLWVVLVEPDEIQSQARLFHDRAGDPVGLFSPAGVFEQLFQFPSVTVTALPRATVEAAVHLRVESVERFSGNVARVGEELDAVAATERVLIACQNEAECHRIGQILASGQLAQSQRLRLVTGFVRAGFRLIESGIVLLGSQQLFHREAFVPDGRPDASPVARRRIEARAIDSFLDLEPGDFVVHVSHGIARYHGMQMLPRGSQTIDPAARDAAAPLEEHLLLEFRDGVYVCVPVSKIDLVQKYIGGSKSEPELSKFGGTSWGNRKRKVEAAVMDLAAEMIELQAVRAAQPGFALTPDTEWQREFEATFPHRETPDQLVSLTEIKSDLQNARPMDRLLCGDVGFGKTELALRAAFKTIDNGKQVAVLVPTTVLAEQHYRTFRDRLSEYPFTVECLSRFRTGKEQRETVKRLAEGGADIAIGTHRLLSADVKFKDLGLVIIDEEQRFGVDHKEQLKRLRAMVHVLTLSATPIPRTLHFSLLGLRDISNLETPPPDRLPIETHITRWDKALIRHAILRELNRDGQVYFVHNRVYNIREIAAKVQEAVPEARIAIGHGQMSADELEAAMVAFVRRDADILVATTIIESGLDIPNANTIFINEADNYGLADLHQLRGRVGRHKNRAYAYLLLDCNKLITPDAARRLKAIEEFTQLGAGFKIALRDLEIRGAGNILGTQQSGHIAAVGYELYCQLLENAVRQLKQQPVKTPLDVAVDLPWPAFLPRDYVPGQKLRIEVYRRLARVRSVKKLDDFRIELRDRYGPPPPEAEWLLRSTEIRILAAKWQIATIHRNGPDLVFNYRNPKKAEKLAQFSRGRLKIVDGENLYWRLQQGEDDPIVLYELLRQLMQTDVK
jgi:transcription-repair coupling factor (superfamily II helicase)